MPLFNLSTPLSSLWREVGLWKEETGICTALGNLREKDRASGWHFTSTFLFLPFLKLCKENPSSHLSPSQCWTWETRCSPSHTILLSWRLLAKINWIRERINNWPQNTSLESVQAWIHTQIHLNSELTFQTIEIIHVKTLYRCKGPIKSEVFQEFSNLTLSVYTNGETEVQRRERTCPRSLSDLLTKAKARTKRPWSSVQGPSYFNML